MAEIGIGPLRGRHGHQVFHDLGPGPNLIVQSPQRRFENGVDIDVTGGLHRGSVNESQVVNGAAYPLGRLDAAFAAVGADQ